MPGHLSAGAMSRTCKRLGSLLAHSVEQKLDKHLRHVHCQSLVLRHCSTSSWGLAKARGCESLLQRKRNLLLAHS